MQPYSTISIHSPGLGLWGVEWGVGEVRVGSTFPQQVSHKHRLSRKSPLGALEPSRVATNYPMCQVLTQHFPNTVIFNDLNNPTPRFRSSSPAGPLHLQLSALAKRLTIAHVVIGPHKAALGLLIGGSGLRPGCGLRTPSSLPCMVLHPSSTCALLHRSNFSLNACLKEWNLAC